MSRLRLTVLLFCLACCLGSAARADDGDMLITDPVLLRRLGFPPDARNVYLAKGAVLDQKSSPAQPEEFGTADSGWTTVLGMQHHTRSNDDEYDVDSDGSIRFISGGQGWFEAQLQMPSGALFQQVTWFGRDQSNHLVSGTVARVCQTGFPAVGPPVVTFLGGAVGSADDPSFTFVVSVPPGETVHNFSCAYVAKTLFSNAGMDLALNKVRAQWRRQVSAAPLTATFPNDVPTTHPFFRFIEALAASGITAGCGPGSFCPSAAITRGEMAVFLSVALGLHSPN
jgi:hypothetical protein